MKEFIARQEMLFIATADLKGECDSSFRAGPPGFVHVIDDRTLTYPEDKALFLKAARINHESAAEFVIRAAREAAVEVVERQQIIRVPAALFDPVAASLEEPAEPIEELASAVRKQHSMVKKQR